MLFQNALASLTCLLDNVSAFQGDSSDGHHTGSGVSWEQPL